jgi:hypothetical protein
LHCSFAVLTIFLFLFAGDFDDMPQEMRQDDSGPTTLDYQGIATTLTSEAGLKEWYLASNPTLRRQGLSCTPELYREMQRDLRDYCTTVSIVPLIDQDDMKRMVDEFFCQEHRQTGPIYLSGAAIVPKCCNLCAYFHFQPGLSLAASLVNCRAG